MKNSLYSKVGVAVATVAFLGMPLFAQAQYGPPSGYEGMTPPSGYEGMTPPSDQMGPPADVQEKMAKGLARMKKGVASMTRAVKTMEKAVAGAEGVGYKVPAEITNSIAKAKAAIETINNATSLESPGIQEALDDMDAFTEVLDANIENLMLMTKFPRILKQADTQYVKLVKFFETTKARLVGLEADTTAAVADVQKKVEAQKSFYDQAAALAKEGKMAEAFAMLEDNFFPGLETTSQSIGVLNAMKAMNKAANGVDRGIKTAERIITKLKGKKVQTSELETIVSSSKVKLAELRVLVKTPGYDLEVAMALLQDLDDLREQFDSKVDALIEKMDIDVGNLPQVNMFTGTKIIMPMDMRKGFESYKDKMGGFKGEGAPSDSFGIDMSGYGPNMQIPDGFNY